MESLILLMLAVLVYLLVGAGFGIAAFVRHGRRRAEMAAMGRQIADLADAVEGLRREAEGWRAAPPGAMPVEPAAMPAAPAPEAAEEPAPPPAEAEETATEAPAEAPIAATLTPAEPGGASPGLGQAGLGGFEEKLASRWILWVGALALALGGAFLVKYAIDEGWLGPATRVSLGFLFGCALTIGGEWLRQRPLERAIAALRPNHVPPALTAAGLFIAFASVYAAFALYDLIAPLTGFALLAALSAGAVFLSLLQGPFTALLGIVGGFATPLLVPSEEPFAWGLFAYLLFLSASATAVVRFTGARWLSAITLIGALLWPAAWLGRMWQPGDGAPLGLYLLLILALFLFLPGAPEADPERQARPFPDNLAPATIEAWAVVAGVAPLVFALLRMDGYGSASLLSLAGFVILSFVAGRRRADLEGMPLAAELLTLAGIAAWHLPRILTTTSPLYPYPQGYLAGPLLPPELSVFLSTGLGFAALFGVGGYALLWRARRPGWWAAVAAPAPVLLLAIAYWRIEDFAVELSWSAVALALAAIEIAAASRLERHRADPQMALSLAAYAAAAVAAISLGAAMALHEAWLTVVLAVELPALAWIDRRLRIEALRPVAAALAAIVLVRLVLNPYVVGYPLGGVPGLNWILYGYGIPAVAFLCAANLFRQSGDDYLVTTLELGAAAFAALLLTLEIHNLLAGPLSAPRAGLAEESLQSIAWLAMAIGLALPGRWAQRRAARWARRVLAGLAVMQIVVFQLLLDNPLWSGAPVGETPVFNLLLLAYGVPAALIVLYAALAAEDHRLLRAAARVLALILVFVDVSLEVRRSFQGPVLSGGATSDAEWYAYSAAWLGYAGLLLALGIRGRSQALRYASLAVLLIAIGKVFLSDMADLTGLYRVVSFVGLGLSLIAVGYLYQRFVFPAPPQDRQEPA